MLQREAIEEGEFAVREFTTARVVCTSAARSDTVHLLVAVVRGSSQFIHYSG